MIDITKENFEEEVLKADKPVIVEFYRPVGCGNCEKMKPLIEQFENANPNVKVCLYECGKEQDEITKKYQFKMFPGIFSFNAGNPIRGYSGIKTLQQLSAIFATPTDLKAAVYDNMQALGITQKNLEFLNTELKEYNQGTIVNEPTVGAVTPLPEPISEPVAIIPLPEVTDPAEDSECPSCQ